MTGSQKSCKKLFFFSSSQVIEKQRCFLIYGAPETSRCPSNIEDKFGIAWEIAKTTPKHQNAASAGYIAPHREGDWDGSFAIGSLNATFGIVLPL